MEAIEKNTIVYSAEGKLPKIEKVVYTAKTHTTGGREGASLSSDGRLDVKLASPGAKRVGTNPEQLFSAGWSACFMSALGITAGQMKVSLPPEFAVDAEVDLATAEGAYFLQARLNVSLPGLDRGVAQSLIATAHQICPYSKLSSGNINVTITLV
jgi:osmotically inducible protein OsmC